MNTGNFSKREHDVIKLLLQGKSNKQIALTLDVSQSTVEYHLKNVYKKLQVSSRTEAVLRLGKSIGDNITSELGKSTVEMDSEPTDNGGKPISTRRIPMKSLLYIIGASLLMAVLVFVLVSVTMPTNKANPKPIIQATITSTAQQSTETPLPVQLLTPTSNAQTVATLTSIPFSIQDIAHFVSENYPDGTNVSLGATFTKTWELQNTGTTTWTTGYSFVMTEGSYPLGESQSFPPVINLPREVMPGDTVEVSANITAPKTDTIYEIHYKLKNSNGQFVSGDGAEVWLKITVGNVQLTSGSVQANNVTITLINMQKNETVTNVEVCAQLPDTQDWNFNGVVLTAGNVQNSLSGLMLKNSKDASTYSSTYRCYVIEFPVGVSNYGNSPVSVTISNIRVPAENNLEANCARAKQQLAPLYPGLDFTCGPMGFFYSNLKLPSGISKDQADKIIMDALEQAIYGPWVLSE
jgi:DNA-binding CsgD family transcriptional regulator